MATTYTVKINKYARDNNPKLPETCGHKHNSEQAADECRSEFTGKLRLGWTDATIIENTPITLTNLSCLKCGHIWIPRKPEPPLTCPKCRQAGWNRPRKNRA